MQKQLSFFEDENQALNFYSENGYFIEEDLFSPELCNEIIEEAKSFPNALDESFRPFMMPHRINEKILEAMKNPKLIYIMSKLVGGNVSGLQTEFFYCKPGTRGFAKHQDNFFVEAKKEVFASAWIALTDTTEKNGGLIAYPGTHNEDLLPTQKIFVQSDLGQDPNANNEETIVPPQYSAINAHVKKGSAFFIHGHLVHASNSNLSDQYRYVLLCTYIKTGENFRPGRYAQREAIDFETPVNA